VLGCSANHVGGENNFDLRLSIGALINLLIWDDIQEINMESSQKNGWSMDKKDRLNR
jgi:hypothetical protein